MGIYPFKRNGYSDRLNNQSLGETLGNKPYQDLKTLSRLKKMNITQLGLFGEDTEKTTTDKIQLTLIPALVADKVIKTKTTIKTVARLEP
jgi:hypothetical protein